MTHCYFCKKEFKENEKYETHGSYQVHAFKTVGNVSMHKKCRKEWEKYLLLPIPKELQ